MTVKFLAFRSPALADAPAPAIPRGPDPTFQSLALLTRLRNSLREAGWLIAECRKQHGRSRGKWGVPKLFFFHRPAETTSTEPTFPEPYLGELVAKMPAEVLAWNTLPDLLDDALTVLPAAVEARRAARTVDGLAEAAAGLADVLPAAGEVAGLLAVPDDQVVLAIHPEQRFGVKVMIRGVADVNQLHVLLADELPGPPVDPRIADAYRAARIDPDAGIFTARFQMFRPDALRADGTLPGGFAGSDSWVWGDESPAVLPLERGERVVLLGKPVAKAGWAVERKFSRLPGDVEVLEHLSEADVTRWLAARCPALPKPVRVAA